MLVDVYLGVGMIGLLLVDVVKEVWGMDIILVVVVDVNVNV